MKLWKRNMVVAAIVVFVCVAVYLNWSYDQGEGITAADPLLLTSQEEPGKTLGEAELVSGPAEESGGIVIESWDSQDLEETPEDSSGYFASAKLNREEARASALSILQGTVEDPEASEAAVGAASESITAMANAALAESQIENLVIAKGYPDCVAFIGENSVSVVVSTETGTLEGADVAKITDIVLGETKYPASSVKVVLADA